MDGENLPLPSSRIRLVGGVRYVLNEAAASSEASESPDSPDLILEDDLAAGAGYEAVLAEVDQARRGNTGANDSTTGPGFENEIPEKDADPAVTMDDRDLDSLIEREISEALGSDSDELQGLRARALDYYFGRPRGDEKSGRSKLQSLDLADMVESVLAQVIPAFTDDLAIEFEVPSGETEAILQAEDEGIAVNHVIQKEIGGFNLFYVLFKDALLLKNCVAEVLLDETEEVRIDEYKGLGPMELMALTGDPREGRKVIDSLVPASPETVDVVLKTITRRKKIRVTPVPPDEVRINSDHDKPTLEDARFVSRRRIMRESELLALGIDEELVNGLPMFGSRTDTTQNSRAQVAKEWDVDTANMLDRPVSVDDCWMRVDYDGDGLVERRRVLRGENGTILSNEPVNYMGLVSGTAFINPHKWLGISLYDKLKEIQDYKTHFLRQAADNASVANNARFGYLENAVNLDHLYNSKPGGGVALKRVDALVPIPTPNILPSVFEMLSYGDKMRTERSGASLDMQSQQVPLQNRTAHGAERVISSMEQITTLMADTLAMTVVKGVYLAVHTLLREHFPEGYEVPKQGQTQSYRKVTPGRWGPRGSISLTLGLSVGERIKMAGALQKVIDQQTTLLQQGGQGTLVTEANIYRSLVEFARMAGLPNPKQYWVDPLSEEGQKAQEGKAKAQQEAAQKQEAAQQQIIDLQREVITAQEETKKLVALMKAAEGREKIAEERRQHTEDTATELTEMDLRYPEQEVPGSKV